MSALAPVAGTAFREETVPYHALPPVRTIAEERAPYDAGARTEAALSERWFAGLAAPARVEDGRRLRIRFPGVPAPGYGPDARDAVIELDGAEICGEVELHLRAGGWRAHGHHRDPAYARVILHVVEENDGGALVTAHEGGRAIPLAVAPPPEGPPPAPFRPPCAEPAAQARAAPALERLGLERLRARTSRARHWARSRGPAHVLYALALETLAGRRNRETFAMIAHQLPLSALLASVSEAGHAAGGAPPAADAGDPARSNIFVTGHAAGGMASAGAAGSAPAASSTPPSDDQARAKIFAAGHASASAASSTPPSDDQARAKIFAAGHVSAPAASSMPPSDDQARAKIFGAQLREAAANMALVRSGGRPAAAPERRLEALGALVARLWPDERSDWPAALAAPASVPRALRAPGIGADTAIELAVNAVLPVAIGAGLWPEAEALDRFLALPAPAPYGHLRPLARWLRSEDADPLARAARLQGALLLHARSCARGACGFCFLDGANFS